MVELLCRSGAPVLVVLHGEHSSAGRIGRILRGEGFSLDIRRPRFGEPLPQTLEAHAGAIIFGGPMSANDEDGFIRTEIDWIDVPLKEGKPFLGICLGAQMLARALGARVYRHPLGRVEIGYYPVRATDDGRAVCAARFPDQVYHWHREGFDAPAGARVLAEGGDFPIQAIRYGASAYGLQFHPEVTYAMMCRWTATNPEPMKAPGAFARSDHLDGWFLHDRDVAIWLEAFLGRWTDRDGVGDCARAAA